MGQTMFRGRDPTRNNPPLLPLSFDHHNEINFSFFVWFRQLFVSIVRRFRFGAGNPLLESNQPHPINFNYNDNQHCVVDVADIEEPILENTAIGGDKDNEIGFQRSVVVQEEKPLLVGEEEEGDFFFSASTVIGGNEDDEIGIERSVMAVEEVQKEEEEPVPVQPPATKSKGKSKKKKKKQSGSLGPYSREQSILLVGEGDFSFSASLAVAFGDAPNTVATSLNSISLRFQHVFREMNQAADCIAKLGFGPVAADWRLDSKLLQLIHLDAIGRPRT